MQRSSAVAARERQAGRAPAAAPVHPVLQLQRAAGNAAVATLISRRPEGTGTDRASSSTGYASLANLVLNLAGPLAVQFLIGRGIRDRNRPTNLLFWARHPEMIGEKILKGQADLAADWVRIRDTIVDPGLRAPQPAAPGPTTPTVPGTPGPQPTTTVPGTGPTPAGTGTLRDQSLATFIAGLKNPAADTAAQELAALEERSRTMLAEKSGHAGTEEKGAGRDELVAGIGRLRERIAQLDSAGLDPVALAELKRRLYLALNDISPFYSQGRNTDLLEGKEQAEELGTSTSVTTRTCNITSLSMALEALGKSTNDYDSGKRDQIAAVAAAFKPEVASARLTVSGAGGDWDRFAGLRLSDFMQLAAIAEVLTTSKPTAAQIATAAKTAWGKILSIYFLQDLAKRFGATTAVSPFTLDPGKTFKERDKEAGQFKAWARKHRGKVEKLVDLRNQTEAAEGDKRVALEAKSWSTTPHNRRGPTGRSPGRRPAPWATSTTAWSWTRDTRTHRSHGPVVASDVHARHHRDGEQIGLRRRPGCRGRSGQPRRS
jgi:hypothetical protein